MAAGLSLGWLVVVDGGQLRATDKSWCTRCANVGAAQDRGFLGAITPDDRRDRGSAPRLHGWKLNSQPSAKSAPLCNEVGVDDGR
jgi:hypothetical protein